MQKYITIGIERETLKEFKILIAKLELINQSLLIENMIKEWTEKNQC